MTKNIVVRFRVESEDLAVLLDRLFQINDSCATIEDFYVPVSNTYFDNLGLPPERKVTRDPKSGWPVND